MNNTKIEFEKRIQEINLYFHLLVAIDNGECQIHCKTLKGEVVEEPIGVELVKILKANGFILLYNLIEATITKSIEAIFEAVYNDQLTFQKLSDNLRKLWLNQKVIPLKAGIDAITYDKILKILDDVAESVIDNQILKLETECIRISGNIDAQEIRNIARKIGFEQAKNGSFLEEIKNKRNNLAHGEFTFGEIGKTVSVKDMIKYKDCTYTHLKDVLKNIERFIEDKKFAK
jgi:hypothetical protein